MIFVEGYIFPGPLLRPFSLPKFFSCNSNSGKEIAILFLVLNSLAIAGFTCPKSIHCQAALLKG
jgi:hypothetical protein